VADKDAGPKLETTQGRTKVDGPLVDSDTLEAVRAASATRHSTRRQGQQVLRQITAPRRRGAPHMVDGIDLDTSSVHNYHAGQLGDLLLA
jgi:hypothetical protein